jgi:hypothetical protein
MDERAGARQAPKTKSSRRRRARVPTVLRECDGGLAGRELHRAEARCLLELLAQELVGGNEAGAT